MSRLTSPCVGCENAGCGSYHDRCQKYQDFIDANKVRKQVIRKYNYSHGVVVESRKRRSVI